MLNLDIDADLFLTIAIFSIAFVLVGFLLPQIITLYAPQGYYIEIDNVTVTNTTTTAESYTLIVEQEVHTSTDGTILLELVQVSNGSTEQAAVFFGPHYFEEGAQTVYYTRALPEDLEEGRYYWVVHFSLTYGHTQRTATVRSDLFAVENTSTNESVVINLSEE